MEPPILELRGVTKDYGRFRALDDVTVSVQPGAIGLLGPNGAGKSTLIKALLGLVKLSGGTAKVLGLDTATSSRRIREVVGYMPEDDCAIAGLLGARAVALAGELAGLPALTSLRRAHEILDYVGLAEERYREIQTYSTGMRQKVKLAQALIQSPQLLFLDEPTNGLDPLGRERMLRLIRNLAQKKGVSVVLSTHILSDVEACCDAVLILARGKVLVYDRIDRLQQPVDPSCRVRFDGDAEMLQRALVRAGCHCAPAGTDELLVSGEGDLGTLTLAAARESGAVVRQIVASHNSLEDIFLTALRDAGDPAQSPAAMAGSR
jgi:ABC-2 type transport system ATP-binding protein